jgi:hypothetical protein
VVVPWQARRRLSEVASAPTAVPQPVNGPQAQPIKRRRAQG